MTAVKRRVIRRCWREDLRDAIVPTDISGRRGPRRRRMVAACNGGGSSTTVPPVAVATAPVILVAGSRRTFAGTDSQMVVYASPSTGQSNYNAASTFSGTTTISKSAPGAPAAWDVNQTIKYTVTQAAKAGTQALSADTDTFDNQTTSGKTTTIAQIASQETATETTSRRAWPAAARTR